LTLCLEAVIHLKHQKTAKIAELFFKLPSTPPPFLISGHFGFNCPSGFREEDI
jgi:hypothetical protein